MKGKGFAPIVILLIVVGVLVFGVIGYFYFERVSLNPNVLYWADVKSAMLRCGLADYQDPPSPGGFRYVDLKNGGMKMIKDTPSQTEWEQMLQEASSTCGPVPVAHGIWD